MVQKRYFWKMEAKFQKEEHEANLFAQNILVPPGARTELINLKAEKHEIMRFAVKIGVSRGIVLGQLQHQGRVRPEQLNWLKRRYRIEDFLSAALSHEMRRISGRLLPVAERIL